MYFYRDVYPLEPYFKALSNEAFSAAYSVCSEDNDNL